METAEHNKCPLVSVLVPVYNVEAYIRRCARSILEQSYSNLEFIFVDDGCTDSSIDILQKTIDEYPCLQERCSIIHHQQNKGIAAARNTAMASCHGDFVFHVDSDDWIELNAIQLLVEKQQETTADIVYASGYYKYSKGAVKVDCHGWSTDKNITLTNILQDKATICLWSKLIKKSLYTDNGIKGDERGSFYEDFQILTRLVYYSRIISCIDAYIYYYNRSNPISLVTCLTNNIEIQRQGLISIQVVRDFFQDKEQQYLDFVKYFYLNYINNMLNANYYERNKKGYDEFLHLLKQTERSDWHVVGWDNCWKRMMDYHYHLRIMVSTMNRAKRKVSTVFNLT